MKNKPKLTAGGLYEVLQDQMSLNLSGLRKVIDHPGMKGDVSEDEWRKMLRLYLPGRYSIETKVKVIDSRQGISDQIDLAIFDGQYAPFIYRANGFCCIPAESVYAVFEVKQVLNKAHIKYAKGKAKSVRRLFRTSVPVPQIVGRPKRKEPFSILAGILTTNAEKTAPKKVKEYLKGETLQLLNIGCSLDGFGFVLENGKLNYSQPRSTLLFFCLKLFKKLQELGTAPAVDVDAYLKKI